MAVAHIVVLGAASLALLFLPCAVAAVLRAGEPVRHPRRREETRALRRVDRELRDALITPPVFADSLPFEVIVVDLRRLAHQRRHGPSCQSLKWHAAVLSAYDQRLSMACRCLGVPEHLAGLDGIDLELERLRVEVELQAAGLVLS